MMHWQDLKSWLMHAEGPLLLQRDACKQYGKRTNYNVELVFHIRGTAVDNQCVKCQTCMCQQQKKVGLQLAKVDAEKTSIIIESMFQ